MKNRKTTNDAFTEIAFQRRNKRTGVQVQLGQTADLQPQVVQGGLNFY